MTQKFRFEDKKLSCGIYTIVNKIDNKKYIGSSKNIEERRKIHLIALINNTHWNIHLQRAFNKYGRESFKFKILKLVIQNRLLKTEQYYLNNLNSLYNISSTANRREGYTFSSEARKNMSKAQIGRKHSLKTRNKMSKSRKIFLTSEVRIEIGKKRKGKKHSLETRKKISVSKTIELREKVSKQLSIIKMEHEVSKETKDKISNSLKGHIPWNKGLKGLKYKKRIEV